MRLKLYFVKRFDWIYDLGFLSLLFFLFYTLNLGNYPLFTPDEARYSEVAREMLARHDFVTPRVNEIIFLDKPIFYYWLQSAGIFLFGLNEWALRIFPTLFAIFGCLMTYGCGRYLFDRRTGLIASLILASTPIYFGAAHYANLDLEVAILLSTSLMLFLMGMQDKRDFGGCFILFAYIFSALAFLTKGLIGIVFPIVIIGFWMVLTQKKLLRKIYILPGSFLFLVIVLPWTLKIQMANPDFFHHFFITQQITRFLSADEFNNKNPVWFYLPIILCLFFPWTIFLFRSFRVHLKNIWHNRFEYQKELFLIIWVTFIFLFFSIPKSKPITYILPLFPPLALLVARYLSTLWNPQNPTQILQAYFYYFLLALFFAFLLFSFQKLGFIDLALDFTPSLKKIAYILIFFGICSLLFIKKEKFLPLFLICIFCNCSFFVVLAFSAELLNKDTLKPLIIDLKKILKPEDEVVNYFKYYQDAPLYLQRRITIATDWDSPKIKNNDNWIRELWPGKQKENAATWLIDEKTFWRKWQGHQRIFVFLNKNYFLQFKKTAQYYFYLACHQDVILLSNQPVYDVDRKTHNLLEKKVNIGRIVRTNKSAMG